MKKLIFLILIIATSLYANRSYTVTIPPMKFFLQSIGQSKISIKTIYEKIDYTKEIPNSHIRKSAYSDVYFTLGLEEEKRYIKYIKDHNPEIEIIDVSKILQIENNNPYIWMDPIHVTQIAQLMLKTLIEKDPHNKEYFELNFKTFLSELDRIFLRIKDALFYSQNAVYTYNNILDYYFNRFDVKHYKAEKILLSGEKFTEIYRESLEKNIKYIITDSTIPYSIYNSWSNANNMKILKVDVYAYDWLSNLFMIAEKLSK